jgi:hypothetical protein
VLKDLETDATLLKTPELVNDYCPLTSEAPFPGKLTEIDKLETVYGGNPRQEARDSQ